MNFVYELVSWCVSKNITATQAELENSIECQTPYMTAVLRDQFDLANLLIKNNLATRGYVNRDGRDVRTIAEDLNKVRALAFLDNREIPQLSKIQRSSASIGHSIPVQNEKTPVKLSVKKLDMRASSVDKLAGERKDDIFGRSQDRDMQQMSDSRSGPLEESKVMKNTPSKQKIHKPKDLPSFNQSRDFDKNGTLASNPYSDINKDNRDQRLVEPRFSQGSSQKSHASFTSLKSPLKSGLRAPKMPKLDVSRAAVEDDDVDQVNVKDFIKNSRRR